MKEPYKSFAITGAMIIGLIWATIADQETTVVANQAQVSASVEALTEVSDLDSSVLPVNKNQIQAGTVVTALPEANALTEVLDTRGGPLVKGDSLSNQLNEERNKAAPYKSGPVSAEQLFEIVEASDVAQLELVLGTTIGGIVVDEELIHIIMSKQDGKLLNLQAKTFLNRPNQHGQTLVDLTNINKLCHPYDAQYIQDKLAFLGAAASAQQTFSTPRGKEAVSRSDFTQAIVTGDVNKLTHLLNQQFSVNELIEGRGTSYPCMLFKDNTSGKYRSTSDYINLPTPNGQTMLDMAIRSLFLQKQSAKPMLELIIRSSDFGGLNAITPLFEAREDEHGKMRYLEPEDLLFVLNELEKKYSNDLSLVPSSYGGFLKIALQVGNHEASRFFLERGAIDLVDFEKIKAGEVSGLILADKNLGPLYPIIKDKLLASLKGRKYSLALVAMPSAITSLIQEGYVDEATSLSKEVAKHVDLSTYWREFESKLMDRQHTPALRTILEQEPLLITQRDGYFSSAMIGNLIHYGYINSVLDTMRANPDFFTDAGWEGSALSNLLRVAGEKNISPILSYLVKERGLDPNKYSHSGYLPLEIAFKSYENIKTLISLGAQVNLRDGNGSTALAVLLSSYSVPKELKYKVANALLENGANPNAIGTDGTGISSNIHLASDNVFKLLIDKGLVLDIDSSSPNYAFSTVSSLRAKSFVKDKQVLLHISRKLKESVFIAFNNHLMPVAEGVLAKGDKVCAFNGRTLTTAEISEPTLHSYDGGLQGFLPSVNLPSQSAWVLSTGKCDGAIVATIKDGTEGLLPKLISSKIQKKSVQSLKEGIPEGADLKNYLSDFDKLLADGEIKPPVSMKVREFSLGKDRVANISLNYLDSKSNNQIGLFNFIIKYRKDGDAFHVVREGALYTSWDMGKFRHFSDLDSGSLIGVVKMREIEGLLLLTSDWGYESYEFNVLKVDGQKTTKVAGFADGV